MLTVRLLTFCYWLSIPSLMFPTKHSTANAATMRNTWYPNDPLYSDSRWGVASMLRNNNYGNSDSAPPRHALTGVTRFHHASSIKISSADGSRLTENNLSPTDILVTFDGGEVSRADQIQLVQHLVPLRNFTYETEAIKIVTYDGVNSDIHMQRLSQLLYYEGYQVASDLTTLARVFIDMQNNTIDGSITYYNSTDPLQTVRKKLYIEAAWRSMSHATGVVMYWASDIDRSREQRQFVSLKQENGGDLMIVDDLAESLQFSLSQVAADLEAFKEQQQQYLNSVTPLSITTPMSALDANRVATQMVTAQQAQIVKSSHRLCLLHIIVDHTYAAMLNRDVAAITGDVFAVVAEIDDYFSNQDLNGDGQPDELRLRIAAGNISIFLDATSTLYYHGLLRDDADELLYLQTLGRYYDRYAQLDYGNQVVQRCALFLLTNRRRLPKSSHSRIVGASLAGTLCTDYGVNIGFATRADMSRTGFVETIAHELGHLMNFPHDNVAGSPCNSSVGPTLMNSVPYAENDAKLRQFLPPLSDCSKAALNDTLTASYHVGDFQPIWGKSQNRRTYGCGCSTFVNSVCGNGIVEAEEQCDCGTIPDGGPCARCCVPPGGSVVEYGARECHWRPGASCDPRTNSCCTPGNCTFFNALAGENSAFHFHTCAPATECRSAAYCSVDGQCQPGLPQSKFLACGRSAEQTRFSRYDYDQSRSSLSLTSRCSEDGECVSLCTAYGLMDCECKAVEETCQQCCTQKTTPSANSQLSVCVPASQLIPLISTTPSNTTENDKSSFSTTLWRPAGSSCLQGTGVCSADGKCDVVQQPIFATEFAATYEYFLNQAPTCTNERQECAPDPPYFNEMPGTLHICRNGRCLSACRAVFHLLEGECLCPTNISECSSCCWIDGVCTALTFYMNTTSTKTHGFYLDYALKYMPTQHTNCSDATGNGNCIVDSVTGSDVCNITQILPANITEECNVPAISPDYEVCDKGRKRCFNGQCLLDACSAYGQRRCQCPAVANTTLTTSNSLIIDDQCRLCCVNSSSSICADAAVLLPLLNDTNSLAEAHRYSRLGASCKLLNSSNRNIAEESFGVCNESALCSQQDPLSSSGSTTIATQSPITQLLTATRSPTQHSMFTSAVAAVTGKMLDFAGWLLMPKA